MTARTHRLFVAVYPPEPARRAMLEALASISARLDARHKVTPADQVHMTVHFIGETREGDLDNVTESVRRSAAGVGAFSLVPRRLISLPERGPVRLIALETDAPPQLIEIHRRLAMRLAKSPQARSADRFLPHLTLCRFRGDASPVRIDVPVSIVPCQVDAIALMQSKLTQAGAIHTMLEEVRL